MALEAFPRTELPRMTEDEFEAWCDEDTRAEFVDGKVIVMAPVSLLHYEVGDFVHALLRGYLAVRPVGRVLGPEITVRLRPNLRRVPDLLYLKKENLRRVGETLIEGPPDAVWEVISPDSEARDWREKLPEYEAAGVPEYWIINPYTRTVHLYRLTQQGSYAIKEPEDGVLASDQIPGFWVRVDWLWQRPTPNFLECLREMGLLP